MGPSDRPRRAIRLASIALLALALSCGLLAAIVTPEFAARHLSADGRLEPYTLRWLEIDRALLGGVAALLALTGAIALAPRVETWLARRSSSLQAGLQRALLAAASAAASIAFAEFAMRAVESVAPPRRTGHDFERESREFMARVRPQLEARGFRDDPFDRPREANERRVLAIGDSFVFGFGVPDARDTFPAALERELERSGPCDVFNAGVPGADTAREIEVLASVLPQVAPDVVVLGYFPNDAESPEAHARFVQQSRLLPLVSDALLRHSALWRAVEPRVFELMVRAGWRRSYLQHLRGLYEPGEFAAQRERIAALVAAARGANRPVAVVLFPLVEDFASYPLESAHVALRLTFAELRTPCLDLLDEFRGSAAADWQASAVDHHLNAAGNARAARATAAFLRAQGIAK